MLFSRRRNETGEEASISEPMLPLYMDNELPAEDSKVYLAWIFAVALRTNSTTLAGSGM